MSRGAPQAKLCEVTPIELALRDPSRMQEVVEFRRRLQAHRERLLMELRSSMTPTRARALRRLLDVIEQADRGVALVHRRARNPSIKVLSVSQPDRSHPPAAT